MRHALVSTWLSLASFAPACWGAGLSDGIWRSQGYGEIVDVRADSFEHYEVTRISCVSRGIRPRDQLVETIGEVTADRQRQPMGGRAPTIVRRGISLYTWMPLDRLPESCEARRESLDPRYLFDIVWQTFDEHYAFFALRNVDWKDAGERLRSRLQETTDDPALFSVLSELLAPLRDRHVRLKAGELLFVSGSTARPTPGPDGLAARHAQLQPALKTFLGKGLLEGPLRSTANDQVWWGRLDGDIGYLALPSLWDFSGRTESNQDVESAAAERAMDEVLGDLGGCRGIIVDLRVNHGGSDAVGLAIAGRFAGKPGPAFTKQAIHEKRLTDPYTVSVAPGRRARFTGPVVALVGPLTASAAEVMTMGLLALPNVTVLGRPTMGLFSDTLYRRLPNGWEFTVSNEVYRTPSGELFEGRGLPPHVASDTTDPPATLQERFGTDIGRAREILLSAARRQAADKRSALAPNAPRCH